MDHLDDSNLMPDARRFGVPSDAPIFPGGIPTDDAGRAAVIRAAADGELDAELASGENSELALMIEDAHAEVSFERGLRAATGRVMVGAVAPAGLRERILASAADAGTDSQDNAMAAGLEERAKETRSAGFWSGMLTRGRVFGAIAAILLIGFASVFVSQMSNLNGMNSDTLAYRTDLARFVSSEHTRTLDDKVADSKYIYKIVDDAEIGIAENLAQTPVIPPCDDLIKFRGAAPCGVPGKGPSDHMQFVLPGENGEPGRTVSVFVKQDRGELTIEEGTAYLINVEACGLSDMYICVWRRDGLLYTLVSEDSNAPMCAVFLSQFGISPPEPANIL